MLGAAAWAFATALRTPPRPYGDAPEYMLMGESLARHGSPDLQEADLRAVTQAFLRWGVEFPPHQKLIGYYQSLDGRRYSYHFWAYSLACLPVRWALLAAGRDPLLSYQVANALFMTLALLTVLLLAPLSPLQKLLLEALLFLSPAAWFILWPHPEVFSFAFCAMALSAELAGRSRTAVLLAAVASLQNPQLAILVALLWLRGSARGRVRLGRRALAVGLRLRWRDALLHGLPALLVLAYPAFYYAHFGTWSIVAHEATSIEKLSIGRALDLLFDLNLGLLPYLPVALLAWLILVARSLARRRAGLELQLFVVAAAILLVDTLQWNFNHGTSGPSRYLIWILPIPFLTLALAATRTRWAVVAALAVAVQAGILASRGGLVPRYDYLQHSPVAAFVLDHFPWAYDPDYEVFIKRTLHTEGPTHGPYVYRVDGRCRKVLANRTQEAEVRRQCGDIPEADRAFFRQPAKRKGGGRAWRYLDY